MENGLVKDSVAASYFRIKLKGQLRHALITTINKHVCNIKIGNLKRFIYLKNIENKGG